MVPSVLGPALQSSSGRRLPVETCRSGEDDTGAIAPRLPQMTRVARSARQGGWCRQRHRVAHQGGNGSLSGAPQTPSATAACQCQSTPDADRTSLFKNPIANPVHRPEQFRQFSGIEKLIINRWLYDRPCTMPPDVFAGRQCASAGMGVTAAPRERLCSEPVGSWGADSDRLLRQ